MYFNVIILIYQLIDGSMVFRVIPQRIV